MCAFCYMNFSSHCRTLLPFACSNDFLSLSCTRVAIPTILNCAIRTVFLVRPSSSAFTFLPRCQRARLNSDLCVHWSTGPHVWWSLVSLSLHALPAPFRRLPLMTLSRESCLRTCLTCLWTDVRIFLHLCTASDWRLAFVYIGLTAVTAESAKLCPPYHSCELLCGVLFRQRAACVCAAS